MRIDSPSETEYNAGRKGVKTLNKENKRTNLVIVVPRFALRFVLELIAQDNPQLKPRIKELLKAYGE